MIKTLVKEIETRNKLLRTLLDPDINGDFYNNILKTILEVSHSKFGLIGYLDAETGANVCPTMTHEIWDECQVSDKKIVWAHELWKDSDAAWARCLNEGITILTNGEDSPHTIPDGHMPLTRSLCMPLKTGYNGDRTTVGILILANKETEYNKDDIDFLEKLADTIGPMIDVKRHEGDHCKKE
jgi:hypothetical protein